MEYDSAVKIDLECSTHYVIVIKDHSTTFLLQIRFATELLSFPSKGLLKLMSVLGI